MEFIKNLFKDDEKIIGLCAFKKTAPQTFTFKPKYSNTFELFYSTNTKNNFLLS